MGWQCEGCGSGEEFYCGCGILSFNEPAVIELAEEGKFGPAMKMLCGNNLSISGNVFYRSGVQAQGEDNSHIILEKCRNLSVTGNTFVIGKDEDGVVKGMYPQYGVIVKDSEECLITSNAMHRGATETLIDIADDCKNIVTTGNIGSASKE